MSMTVQEKVAAAGVLVFINLLILAVVLAALLLGFIRGLLGLVVMGGVVAVMAGLSFVLGQRIRRQ